MNLREVIESHGAIVAADGVNDLVIAWDADAHVFTVLTGNQNGEYNATEQYDGEGEKEIESALQEGAEVLAEFLSDGEDE